MITKEQIDRMNRLGILFSGRGNDGDVSFECLVLRSWIKILILEKVMRMSGYSGELPDMPFFLYRSRFGYGLVVSNYEDPPDADPAEGYDEQLTRVGEFISTPNALEQTSDFLLEIGEIIGKLFHPVDLGMKEIAESFGSYCSSDETCKGCAELLNEAYYESLISGNTPVEAKTNFISDLNDCSAQVLSDGEYAKECIEDVGDVLDEIVPKCKTVEELAVSIRALSYAGGASTAGSYEFGRYGYDFSMVIPVKKPDCLELSGGLGEYDICSLSYTDEGIRLFCCFDFSGDMGGEDHGFVGVLSEDTLEQGVSAFTEVFAVLGFRHAHFRKMDVVPSAKFMEEGDPWAMMGADREDDYDDILADAIDGLKKRSYSRGVKDALREVGDGIMPWETDDIARKLGAIKEGERL